MRKVQKTVVFARLLPMLLVILACQNPPDSSGEEVASQPIRRLEVFEVDDSVGVDSLSDNLLRAIAVDDSTFALASYPIEPLCLFRVKENSVACRSVNGGGPAEVIGLEQLAVWPPSSIAVWDRQSGRLGVWNRRLEPDSTVRVNLGSANGYDLLGVESDSTIVLARSLSFAEMPLGTAPNSSRIVRVKGEVEDTSSNVVLRDYWLSIAQVGDRRSGFSIPSYRESFAAVTQMGITVVDARKCTLEQVGHRVTLAQAECVAAAGFRKAVLRHLDTAKIFGAEAAHRALARRSKIPEGFTAVMAVLSNYRTGERLLKVRSRDDTSVARWLVVGSGGDVSSELRVSGAYRLIGFSSCTWLAIRNDRDGLDGRAMLLTSKRNCVSPR